MQADDPPFLPVGTDVSAKYKGAFCEAKIKKVVKNIKCKVSFKAAGLGSTTVTDEAIKGTLRVGNTVEVRQDPKKDLQEALITKIQDCSQYTVVFDDGDITTLRRSALCLKSGRHFAESETLDQLPLTHPEHFGNPVIGSSSRRGRRTNRSQSDDSDSEATDTITTSNIEREPHTGRVVLVQCGSGGGGGGGDKKRPQSSGAAQGWFPGLVVAPGAQDTVKIKVKEDYLVRSFKDGRYYTVPKKEAKEFKRSAANSEMGGLEAALQYLDKDVLPPHWDRDILFGQETQSDDMDSDDSSDDEPREEKDHFVAQLYKFMDDRGTPLNRQPTIANKDIDLYRLFNVVQKLGGYNRVTNQNQWKGIANRLGFQPPTTSVTNLCKQAYKKFLHSFEEFYRKLGVTLVAHPRGGRSTGRSLIRDRDKIQNQSSSPAHSLKDDEKPAEKPVTPKTKEKEVEKEIKVEKDIDVKDKETPTKSTKEAEIKEKEVKGKDVKVVEKEIKKEGKKEIIKEVKLKSKRETKVKTEVVQSSEEEDSGDNQPLAPLSNKLEKSASEATLSDKSSKATETPIKKVYKNMASVEGTAGKRGLDRGEKGSAKKVMQRRGSSARTGLKEVHSVKESRSKSEVTPNKKQDTDNKGKEKETPSVVSAKKGSSSDKNDSDSSSRGSKSGKMSSRRNITPSDTPPSTPGSSSGSQHSKKPRKRKIMETTDKTATTFISCDVGDKLKVYYGPAQSESKVTYEAKVIEVAGRGADTLLRVHYTGWNTRYDEWIKPSRIADNLTQKNKHKDKGRRNQNTGTGPPEGPSGKKARQQIPSTPSHPSSATKTRTRYRSSSNNTTASNQQTTDVQSDSDSECESDSSGQRGVKRLSDDKTSKDRGANDTSPPIDKVLENEKEKILRMGRVSRSPQVKRITESPGGGTLHSRVKRTRLKQEDREQLPRGRDFDLNEIRSELKGFEKTVKSPITDNIKMEVDAEPAKEELPSIIIKQEKTPEKVTEDIYEFKEPEPFEFEARKSEEKKKRTTHRIFDDLPQIKLSPTRTTVKSPVIAEGEKSPTQLSKSHLDTVFDKLCESESFNIDSNNSNSAGKESEALSIFSDLAEANEDSGDRLLISETEDSQGPLFTYQHDIFPEKSFLPIFKGFTPAKNQETYSKKDATSKLRDIDDDLTSSSALKGEQSSDEDPIGTAIKRVNEHPMSDDSNDSELLKTPAPSVSAPSTSVVISTTEVNTPTLDLKPKTTIADTKTKSTVIESKTKSPLLDIKTKTVVPEVKTKSPLIDIKTKPSLLEPKTRSPLLDIRTKPSLLEGKTKSPLLDIRTKSSLIDVKTKSPLIDIKTKPALLDIKTKSPLIDIKTKTNLLDMKTKLSPLGVKMQSQDKPAEQPSFVEVKETSKDEEKIIEKPTTVIASVTEAIKNKQETQSTNIVNKESIISEVIKKDVDCQEPKETNTSTTATIDSDSQIDSKSESDGVGSFADIVIPDPPSFLIQKEGPSIADKVLRAINNNKRAATPTPKDAKILKLDSSAKLSKVQSVSKTQTSKVTNTSVSDSCKTSTVETSNSASGSHSLELSKDSKDNNKVTSKSDISLIKDISKEPSTSELFSRTDSSLTSIDSLTVKKDSVERRKSGAEPTSLGGKSNKVLSETIQKLSSQISQPTPPLPEFKDERSEDSDSSESDRRLIIDKLSEEESQSGISESATSQPPKVQSDKSATNWSETDSLKDTDNEKPSNTDSLTTKEGTSSKVPEEDSNISLLLCEETIPGSPAPENLADGVKTNSKQKARILEIPFASAPSISPDQAKDPLSLKDMSRDNSRDGMGSSRNERDRERDRDADCLGTGASAVDTVMDNTPPVTPDSSLDNMSPSRDQMLSDGDNPSETSKPAEEENRISAISKKLNEVEKSNSGSNLRGSAPGSPVVGVPRRGRRPRSLRASEGEDHHQSVTNTSSITGAHSSPQYNTPHPRPLRYNFYVELDEGMDAAARIALLTSRLADLRKAYHGVKAELATIDRRRKKLRRKEREAVKAAKAACAT